MKARSRKLAHLAAALVSGLALLIPGLSLCAQESSGNKPKGMMSGPAPTAAASAVDGVISSIDASTMVVSGASGEAISVQIQPDTLILGRESARLESIKPGEALGVAAIREKDGSLSATAINVFPKELWQRVRKGQFPMASGQVMTNAQVERIVQRVEGRTLYLKYEMLDAAIMVPSSAQIRRSVTRQLSDLKVGTKVSIRLAAGEGSRRAAMISMDIPAG